MDVTFKNVCFDFLSDMNYTSHKLIEFPDKNKNKNN